MVKTVQIAGIASTIRRAYKNIRQFCLTAFDRCKYILSGSNHKDPQQLEQPIKINTKNHRKTISKQQLRKYVMKRSRGMSAKSQKKLQASILKNIHDFKSKQSRKQQDFLTFLRQHAEEIICSICRSELLNPVTTPCNHVFCLQCIEKCLINSQHCPLCRHVVSTEQNYGLTDYPFVQLFITTNYQRNQSKEEEERVKQFNSWKQQRFIKDQNIATGLKIDVWKLESREWKSAQVVQLQRDQGDILTSLLIKYDQQTKQSNQIIDMPSLRIAKHRYYSKIPSKLELTLTSYRIHNSPAEGFQFTLAQPPPPRRWDLPLPPLTQRPNPFTFVTNRFMAMRRLAPEQQVSNQPSSLPTFRQRLSNSIRNLVDVRDSDSDQQNGRQVRFSFGESSDANAARLDHLNPQSVQVVTVQQRQSEIELLLNLNPAEPVQRTELEEERLNDAEVGNEPLELNQL